MTFRFYLGDCVDVLASLPRGSAGAIITSPPYNLGIRYRSYDDTMPREEYLTWTRRWVHEAAGAMDANAAMASARRVRVMASSLVLLAGMLARERKDGAALLTLPHN